MIQIMVLLTAMAMRVIVIVMAMRNGVDTTIHTIFTAMGCVVYVVVEVVLTQFRAPQKS